MTYTIPAGAKRPTNSYEAAAWVFSYGKEKSVHAFAVSMALANFWNMDGKSRRCNPSVPAIMKKTGIKSKNTVLKALEELEDLGEWVVSHSKGHAPNYYFPMFVEGAKADRLAGIEEQRASRKEAMKFHKTKNKNNSVQPAGEAPAVEPISETAELEMMPYVEADPEPEPDIAVPVSVLSSTSNDVHPKVVTERDAQIRATYLAAQVEKASDDYLWEVPLPEGQTVIDAVTDSAWTALKEQGNTQGLFVAGSEDCFQEEMAGRWISRFGARYGKTITYSYIQDIYDNFKNQPFEVQDRMDAAMFVLGSLAKAPTLAFLNVLLFRPFADLVDDETRDLHSLVDNTAQGRHLTRRNFAACSPGIKQYSEQF